MKLIPIEVDYSPLQFDPLKFAKEKFHFESNACKSNILVQI